VVRVFCARTTGIDNPPDKRTLKGCKESSLRAGGIRRKGHAGPGVGVGSLRSTLPPKVSARLRRAEEADRLPYHSRSPIRFEIQIGALP